MLPCRKYRRRGYAISRSRLDEPVEQEASVNRETVQMSLRLRVSIVVVFAVVGLGLVSVATPALPRASDYHSLLIVGSHPATMLLGTHTGLYRSTDGGRTWRRSGLAGEDAMNLVRS